jgi:hypothetical protein
MGTKVPQHKRMAMGEKVTGMKSGGSVKGGKHTDAAMDKAMIKKMVKPGAMRKG